MALIRAVEEWSAARGATTQVAVMGWNAGARRLYERAGYEVVGPAVGCEGALMLERSGRV
jgi:GNAT superfamily N-acetyltransferase